MSKKYIVELTGNERSQLQALVQKGKAAAYKIKHAHILLKADQGPEGLGSQPSHKPVNSPLWPIFRRGKGLL